VYTPAFSDAVFFACALALALLPLVSPAQTPGTGSDLHAIGDSPANPAPIDAQPIDVQTIFQLTNEDRLAQGLSPLAWNPELARAAAAHARRMADAGQLSHQYADEPDLTARASQAGAHFSSIAENIAQGGRPRQIEQEWMHSVPHRTNILDPRMNAIGVGLVAAAGALWAVEDFADAVIVLTPSAVEDKVEAELRGIVLPGNAAANTTSLTMRSREEARLNCPRADGLLPGSQAGLVLRWQGSDLALPPPLVDAVRSGRYSAASVGACPPSGNANRAFVTYRVAVLLY
jgi:hypothetical protein